MLTVAGVYLWMLGQADVMLADAGPTSAKTGFDYEIYMKECHELWGQGRSDHAACVPVKCVQRNRSYQQFRRKLTTG